MENHPIPQNVTGFQFKLIGDMTLKQFGYLAAGIVLGWIFLSAPIFLLIKFPIGLFFVVMGFSLAFVPAEGRPMDMMIMHYLKALFAPNQYVFQKANSQLLLLGIPAVKPTQTITVSPKSPDKLEEYLKNVQKPKNKYDEKETAFFNTIAASFSATTSQSTTQKFSKTTNPNEYVTATTIQQQSTTQPKHQSIPHGEIASVRYSDSSSPKIISSEEEKPEAGSKLGANQEELALLKKQLEEVKLQQEMHHDVYQKALDYQKQLAEVLDQKKQLENQFISLRRLAEAQGQRAFTPSLAQAEMETQNVRKVPKAIGARIGVPFAPDVPNLISGVVKDPRGNILPSILIEIKDKDGNPVRAFKTNHLGQFASATTLSNGSYTLHFEDPKEIHTFDTVALNVSGEIIQPLEVVSTDAREELHKQLFGQKK